MNVSRKDIRARFVFSFSPLMKSPVPFAFFEANEAGLFILKNYRKTYIAFCTLLTTIVFLFGCKSEPIKTQTPESVREITDDLGRSVKLPLKVDRAVTLAPNLTEIVFAVGGGDKLVGNTSFCDYPEEAKKIQKVGDTMNPNLETIVALKPQVVFVSTASQIESFTKTLSTQNIAVFVTDPKSLDGIYKSIFQIGEILGKDEKAHEVVETLKKRVSEVETKTNTAKDVRVFVQISKDSLYTIGKDSFMTDLVARAGGISVTAELPTGYPKLSKETALALQPEAIILSESGDNLDPNEVFNNSPAVKNGKVFRISADLLSRPGPRLIDGLEQIARSLHPESFQ